MLSIYKTEVLYQAVGRGRIASSFTNTRINQINARKTPWLKKPDKLPKGNRKAHFEIRMSFNVIKLI